MMSLFSIKIYAESPCEMRPGTSIGIKVIEFATGNIVHSKIPLSEGTPEALYEEMVNLQDMGVCEEKMPKDKCLLKFEKKSKKKWISLYRGKHKWNSWSLQSKEKAQSFVKDLKRAGFCS